METLLPLAAEIGALLKARGQTISISESSTGGLMSAALLSVPGASAWFIGGAVIYTKQARDALLPLDPAALRGLTPLTEAFVLRHAQGFREQLGTDWVLAEIGASGPAGSRYGDPAGTACLALVGPVEGVFTVKTGTDDRVANMRSFALAGLERLRDALSA